MTHPVVCPECIEQGVKAWRKPAAGATRNRCTTHWRLIKKARKAASHDVYVQRVYGLPPGGYEDILASQGGTCVICKVATGKSKRLATDHCHVCNAVRGALCGPDNQLIGRLGPEALRRAAAYLELHQERCCP